MKWTGRRQSSNVEDRRGMSPRGRTVIGGGLGIIVIIAFAIFTDTDPIRLLDALTVEQAAGTSANQPAQDDEVRQFVSTVLADTEEVWTEAFATSGKQYKTPRLVLYSGTTEMPGGLAQGATGPFYLPADQTIYLDFSFFDEMRQRFGMNGDFAAAYVIAHEVGHHVQHLLGLTDQVHGQAGRISDSDYNQLSVRLELQADFLAGFWAHHADKRWQILEEGDIDEALGAAAIVGDDRLQKATRGRVVPDSFTHGTSEQRTRWFLKGFQTGKLADGDTFQIPYGQL